MRTALAARPWVAAIVLAAAALVLFTAGVARVDHPVFDENHYLPAARHIVALDRPTNVEHPLVGKTFTAAGIVALGDNPLGWRLPSTIAGAAAVAGVFALTFVLFGSVWTASVAAVVALLNGMLYVQARVGMPDVFLCAFMVWGVTLAAVAARSARPLPPALAAGVLLGLATATKWMAAPMVAAVCIGLLWVRRRDLRLAALRGATGEAAGAAHMGGRSAWTVALALGAAAVCAYFVSFWPAFFYATDPLRSHDDLIALQVEMYRIQTQIPTPHNYQSGWASWPFNGRPIWYLFEAFQGGQRSIIMLANPATAAMGIAGTAVCLARWWRTHDPRQALAACLWLFAWGVFAIIPKAIGFNFYFVPASLLQAVCVAAALHRDDGRLKALGAVAMALAAIGFATFYPIYAGVRTENGVYNALMWSERWR